MIQVDPNFGIVEVAFAIPGEGEKTIRIDAFAARNVYLDILKTAMPGEVTPSGINLLAEGFADYLKALGAPELSNQAVFQVANELASEVERLKKKDSGENSPDNAGTTAPTSPGSNPASESPAPSGANRSKRKKNSSAAE